MTQTLKIIEYDHDIKDKVFFMKDNKVFEGIIVGLNAYLYSEKDIKKTKIEYAVLYENTFGSSSNINLKSDLLFESKSKLLDSL